MIEAVYGMPPPGLEPTSATAVQVSPLIPASARLEDLPEGALQRFVVAAPAGALERRYVLALALRALAPGGLLVALAPKDRGGHRLARELDVFGAAPTSAARRHHRICVARRLDKPAGLAAAIEAGGPQFAERLGLWSQPGLFSWDRLDTGTALLKRHVAQCSGAGADLGAGAGALAVTILEARAVTSLALVDIDRRAIDAARRNVGDSRAQFLWRDVRDLAGEVRELDFLVMNPPFHRLDRTDLSVSETFVRTAFEILKKNGVLRMVANVALPYERLLSAAFSRVAELERAGGFKVLEAVR